MMTMTLIQRNRDAGFTLTHSGLELNSKQDVISLMGGLGLGDDATAVAERILSGGQGRLRAGCVKMRWSDRGLAVIWDR